MNVQNNVNFTGLYLNTKEPMAGSAKSLNKLSRILKDRGEFINRLDKEENTDVFINETLDKVSLIHKKYGADMHKYMEPEIPLNAFSVKNEENIVKTLREAVKKISHDWNMADIWAQLHR